MTRNFAISITIFILLVSTPSFAATDGIYTLSEVSGSWDGTSANTLATVTNDYNYVYGDDATLTYPLPWTFFIYGHGYNQITIDTNGAIWFDVTSSARDFNLASSGRGVVLAPWNLDLSSVYEGGVFVQHKTDPDRVVIEWRTETYSDEGNGLPNNFEVVLFANGNIRFDYQAFLAVGPSDSGSGISKDDGSHYLSTTTIYGNSYTLLGRSFSFIPVGGGGNITLSVDFVGTGSGMVTSIPAGIACNTNCFAEYPIGTQITLYPMASKYSFFSGWSGGGCTGLGDCVLSPFANTLVKANFTYDSEHQVKVDGGTVEYYSSLQAAYDAASDGAVMKLWGKEYAESLSCGRPINVTLKGGYDSSYQMLEGETVLNGTLTIIDGTVVVDGLSIR